MTLIAGFMRNDCPILMGDILISNKTESGKELTIPTVGKITSSDLRNGIYQPSAFSQKVNLLSPQLALAWSGNLLEAKELLAQVIGAGFHNNPSREKIIEIYNDLAPRDLCVIGLLRDGKNIGLFDINCEKVVVRDSSFRWFKAGGTGYSRLLGTVPEMHSALTGGTLNKLEYGISAAIEFTSNFLALELQTGITLHEMFGAGYEILHPLGNGLAKFADLTYCFWSAEERTSGNWYLTFPQLVMKYSYHKDILVIRSARLSRANKKTNTPQIESDELHMITPIYRIVNDDELVGYNPASLNSKFLSNIFLCKNFKGEVGVFSAFGRYNNEKPPIIWTNEFSSAEGVDINLKFLSETLNQISSKFISH